MDAVKEINLLDQAITIVSYIRGLNCSLNDNALDFIHYPILDKEEREFIKQKLESATIKTSFGEIISLEITFSTSENTRRKGPSPNTKIRVHIQKTAAV